MELHESLAVLIVCLLSSDCEGRLISVSKCVAHRALDMTKCLVLEPAAQRQVEASELSSLT